MEKERSDVIEDLVGTLSLSNFNWNAWELEFIESLDGKEWNRLTKKQQEKALELWEKI